MSRAKLCKLSILYLYLPVMLMMAGWCRFWFGIPAVILLMLSVSRTMEKIQSDDGISFGRSELVLCAAILVLAAYYSGWGGRFPSARRLA